MLAVKQQQSADAELDSHGNPHAAQAERSDEKYREAEADDPDAAKVQKARHKRIACSAEGSGGAGGASSGTAAPAPGMPQTGDAFPLVWVTVAAAACVVLLAVLAWKKNRETRA